MNYSISNGTLTVTNDEETRKFIPRSTRIEQVIHQDEIFIIREDYMKYDKGSNIYAIDKDFKLLWEAELPYKSDIYANEMFPVDGGISCCSWGGHKCKISTRDGKILNRELTK